MPKPTGEIFQSQMERATSNPVPGVKQSQDVLDAEARGEKTRGLRYDDGVNGSTLLPDIGDINVGNSSNGISSSFAFSNRDDYDRKLGDKMSEYRSQLAESRRQRAKSIGLEYDPAIGEAEEYKEDVTEATAGALGTKRRMSSAALVIVDTRRGEAQKQVNSLKQMKEQAMSNLDTELAKSLDDKINAWEEKELKWAGIQNDLAMQDFNMMMQKAGLAIDVSRENRAIAGEEADQKQKMKDNFKDLISFGYDFSTLNEQDKQSFADSYGIGVESAGDVFDTIKLATDADKANNEVDKMKNVYSLLDKIPQDQEIQIGEDTYKGMKSNNENVLNYEKIEGGKRFYVGYNKATGKEEYRLDMGAAYKPTAGKVISLNEAIQLGDPTLAGKPYGAIPEGTEAPPTKADEQTIASYEKDLGGVRAKLAKDEISWDEAFAEISGKYNDINWNDIESELDKTKYGGHTGANKKSGVVPVSVVPPKGK